jgi:AraC-like DNA-binding protein
MSARMSALPDYREDRPDPRLAPWVRCLWRLRTPRGGAAPPHERLLPDGCVELVLHLGAPFALVDGTRAVRQGRALLAGATRRAVVLAPAAGAEVLGVRFAPGGARLFLRGGLAAWTDAIVPLEALEDAGLVRLAARVASAEPEERVPLVERELLARLADARVDRRLDRAVAALVRGAASVDEVARGAAIGARQLERRFRAEVGLGPKALARVARLQRALALLAEPARRAVAHFHSRGYVVLQYPRRHAYRDLLAYRGRYLLPE